MLISLRIVSLLRRLVKYFLIIQETLKSRLFPEQAYRTCLGMLSLAAKYELPLWEQACKTSLETKQFSYKAIQQEAEFLIQHPASPAADPLPTHENIRGAQYYQERF